MVRYKVEDHIKDRKVWWYEVIHEDELLMSGEVDESEESLEEHRLWLEKLSSAISDKERHYEGV